MIAAGLEEEGVLAGNLYDKYGSRNPIVRALMSGFERSLENLVSLASPRTIHEVGCGEGRWTIEWAERGIDARGSDFSAQVIALAQANAARLTGRGKQARFRVASVYDLDPAIDSAELVVCCEVLEHLEAPRRAVEALARLASPWLVASVPNEPLWSAMNVARGKYWSSLGNTPGHVQRWTPNRFVALLAERFDIVRVQRPLPWTMALCRTRKPRAQP
ncbi:MAG TPA: class I SAM-dependent methyltransferase [Gammaproteobacteria bacterium]|nr:class I SAM-dependent methyltransferase [Gammaproteobacteria bacterium]